MFGRFVASVLFLGLVGCVHAPATLDLRVDPSAVGLDARRGAAVSAFNELADQLQATASYYDRQGRIQHLKLRAMSVFSAISAATAAGLVPAAIHPDMPDSGRRVLGTFAVSLGANAVVFGLVPHAHQYSLKEVGYQSRAVEVRDAYRTVAAACGPAVLADAQADPAALDA